MKKVKKKNNKLRNICYSSIRIPFYSKLDEWHIGKFAD
jgi:hypothetical protein